MIVWDAGSYRNLDEERSMAEQLDAGHVRFWLEGQKLTRRLDAAAHAAAAPSRSGCWSSAATRAPTPAATR